MRFGRSELVKDQAFLVELVISRARKESLSPEGIHNCVYALLDEIGLRLVAGEAAAEEGGPSVA
jgi:hypothetical protein